MDEGWATLRCYNIMKDRHNEGLITEGVIMGFLKSHTNVVLRPEYIVPVTVALIRTCRVSRCSMILGSIEPDIQVCDVDVNGDHLMRL